MKIYKRFLIVLVIAVAALATSASQAGEALISADAVPAYRPKYYPFDGGEKGIYQATWNGMFAVATAEIHTVPTVLDGRKAYQVRVEAKTSRALDLIWRMRDTITSTFEAKGFMPSRFTFQQRENSRIIDTDARFDPAAKQWAVNRQQAGKKPRAYHFDSNNTLDPITAVYLARSTDFKVGDKLYFKVFGGRYQYLLELFIEKKNLWRCARGIRSTLTGSFRGCKTLPRTVTPAGSMKRLYGFPPTSAGYPSNSAANWRSAVSSSS